MGMVDEIEEVLALVAIPAGSGIVQRAVGVDPDGEVVDRGEPGEVELRVVGERPVGGEAEHFVRCQGGLVGNRARRGRGKGAGRRWGEIRRSPIVEPARDRTRSSRTRRDGQFVGQGRIAFTKFACAACGPPRGAKTATLATTITKTASIAISRPWDRCTGSANEGGLGLKRKTSPSLGDRLSTDCASIRQERSAGRAGPGPDGERHGDKVLHALRMIPTARHQFHSPFIAFSRWCHLCNQEDFSAQRGRVHSASQAAPLHTACQTRFVAVHDVLHVVALSRVKTATGHAAPFDVGSDGRRRCAALSELFHGEHLPLAVAKEATSVNTRIQYDPRSSDGPSGCLWRRPTQPDAARPCRTQPDAAREVLTVGPRASARSWGAGDPATLIARAELRRATRPRAAGSGVVRPGAGNAGMSAVRQAGGVPMSIGRSLTGWSGTRGAVGAGKRGTAPRGDHRKPPEAGEATERGLALGVGLPEGSATVGGSALPLPARKVAAEFEVAPTGQEATPWPIESMLDQAMAVPPWC